VHDKTVRRRRAVLGLLVVLSLLLLTAYFGEAPNGRLHGVQRDFLTVVSPIQDGANKALKPVRDLFSWFGNTLHAKSQLGQALKQTEKLRRELVALQEQKRSYHELLALTHLDQLGVGDYRPVTATVIDKNPNIWYSEVTIDKGESSGVRRNDPVINEEGLVGKVAQVASDGAVVELLTNSSMGVSARIGTSHATGLVQPKVGDPNDLLLNYLPTSEQPSAGEYVVTSGTVTSA
jgi:rod shape-determining protein MreC